MTINNLDEFKTLLALLREAEVRQFNLGEMQIVLDVGEVLEDEDEEYDEKKPATSMGFETVNYGTLDIETEFDV